MIVRALNGVEDVEKGTPVSLVSIKRPSIFSAKVEKPCLGNKQTKTLKIKLYDPQIVMLGI